MLYIILLYLSPERIQQPVFKMQLPYLKPLLCVIDEAHCISQWGHDFRHSYLNLGKIRETIPEIKSVPPTIKADEAEHTVKDMEVGNFELSTWQKVVKAANIKIN